MNEPKIEWARTRASSVWKPRMKMQWKATGRVRRTAIRPDQRWMRFTRVRCPPGGGTGTMAVSFPKILAPVSTWTIANNAAADANQALKAIGVEKTLV